MGMIRNVILISFRSCPPPPHPTLLFQILHRSYYFSFYNLLCLLRFTPSSQLEIRGPVDFGSTVADGKVLTGFFSIDNYGSKAGEFKIKYNGKKPLTLSPTTGVVEAETSQKIKVILYVIVAIIIFYIN